MALEGNYSTRHSWSTEDERGGFQAQLYDAPLLECFDSFDSLSQEASTTAQLLPDPKATSRFKQLQAVYQPTLDDTVNSRLGIGMPYPSTEMITSPTSTVAGTSFPQMEEFGISTCPLPPWSFSGETASIEDPPTYPCFAGLQFDSQPLKGQSATSNPRGVNCKLNHVKIATRTHPIRQSTSASMPSESTAISMQLSARKPRTYRTTYTCSPSPSDDDATANKKAKRAHSLVERRYREGLNKGLEELEKALLQAQLPEVSNESAGVTSTTSSPGKKKKKSHVLADAMNYIYTSEVDMRHLSDEVGYLSERVKILEKLVKCEECPIVAQMNMMRLAS